VESVAVVIALAIFAVPMAFLVLAIRHFVPLMRGFKAPLWVYALGPLAFISDRYFSESARPHRKRFLVFVTLFVISCEALFYVFGKQ